MSLLERRIDKFKEVISRRQLDIAVLLENVHDPHNVGAVLRSCDSVGIQHIYILNTDPRLQHPERYESLSTSSGAAKWMNIHYSENMDQLVTEIKSRFGKLISTHLSSDAKSVYDMDFSESFCLAFGNEHEGISEELLSKSDANMIIPQFGMVQSLNISVACAVSLFEVCRQRIQSNRYNVNDLGELNTKQQTLLEEWINIHKASKIKGRF